jgi:hypothetical protein
MKKTWKIKKGPANCGVSRHEVVGTTFLDFLVFFRAGGSIRQGGLFLVLFWTSKKVHENIYCVGLNHS